ncbi:MAG: tetratricopeptide repeat protein [Planctomycetes bacterium]|nr:tetratricopeptide repeat protein [Planctomycetota bacterium]
MKNQKLVMLAALFILAITSVARAEEWWDDEWSHRVTFSNPRQNDTARADLHLVFPCGMEMQPHGRDVRVVNESEEILPCFRVWTEPGDMCELIIKNENAQGNVYVYYGNPGVRDDPPALEDHTGLMLEISERPANQGHPNNLREMRSMIQRARQSVYGRTMRNLVWDGYNPLGPSEYFISNFVGTLEIKEAGTYKFATLSDDASFVLIDDELVCEWPGGHGPQPSVNPNREQNGWFVYSGSVELSAGVHKFEYLHEEAQGGQVMACYWSKPGESGFVTLPGEAFTQLRRLSRLKIEERGKPVCPTFTYVRRSEVDLGADRKCLEIEFIDYTDGEVPVISKSYDFGDGVTGPGSPRPVRHVYLSYEKYNVTLRVRDEAGNEYSVTRNLRCDILFHQGDDERRIEKYIDIVEGYDFSRLSRASLETALVLVSWNEPRKELEGRIYDALISRAGESMNEMELLRYKGDLADICVAELQSFDRARELFEDLSRSGSAQYQIVGVRGLAQVHYELSEYDEAKRLATDVLASNVRGSQIQFLRAAIVLGDVAAMQGDAASAKAAYESAEQYRILELTDEQEILARNAYPPRAINFLYRQEFISALRECESWELAFPADKIDGYLQVLQARSMIGLEQYERARKALELGLRVNPRSNYADEQTYLQGACLFHLGKFDEAKTKFESIAEEYPQSDLLDQAERYARRCAEAAEGAEPSDEENLDEIGD